MSDIENYIDSIELATDAHSMREPIAASLRLIQQNTEVQQHVTEETPEAPISSAAIFEALDQYGLKSDDLYPTTNSFIPLELTEAFSEFDIRSEFSVGCALFNYQVGEAYTYAFSIQRANVANSGIDIALERLIPDMSYLIIFKMKMTEGEFNNKSSSSIGAYSAGFKVQATVASSYTAFETYPNNIMRDSDEHLYAYQFSAENDKMYLSFILSALKNVAIFEITDFRMYQVGDTLGIPFAFVKSKTIAEPGTYNANDDGLDGYSTIIVDPSLGIEHIEGETNLIEKNITASGNYDPADDHVDGYSLVHVSVKDHHGTKLITEPGTYLAQSDNLDGYDIVVVTDNQLFVEKHITQSGIYEPQNDGATAYSKVIVEAKDHLGEITITEPGEYLASDESLDGYSKVIANVAEPAVLITKQVNMTGIYNASDDNADGYSQVEVLSTGDPDTTKLIEGTLENYTNTIVSAIGPYTFFSHRSLKEVNFVVCTAIGANAFCSCPSLTTVVFPMCAEIGIFAFMNCYSLKTLYFPECTSIGSYAFDYCNHLVEANFPKCKTIGSYAFYQCFSLNTISFPLCTYIGSSAFCHCSKLTHLNFTECVSINNSAFQGCSALIDAVFPACIEVGNFAFYNCSALTTISFPSCTKIGVDAFGWCFSLAKADFPSCLFIESNAFIHDIDLSMISFPVCQTIGSSAFAHCPSLTEVNLPSCNFIGQYAFSACSALSAISCPSCLMIGSLAFYWCTHLLSIYLMGSTVCDLIASDAFMNTPIANYTASTNGQVGSIYVPQSLYSAYRSADNWSYFASRFVSV